MQPDVIIIGSGMGGATLAAALAPTGRRILILERGDELRPSAQDRDAGAIFGDGCFRSDEDWLDGTDTPFNPGNYYNVGGNSKFYGAALLRYRETDFAPVQHAGGETRGWPLTYAELEPDYLAAEQLYAVRGDPTEDPTEPAHSGTYPHGPVPDEPDIAALRRRLKAAGLHPSAISAWDQCYRLACGGADDVGCLPQHLRCQDGCRTCGLKAALAYPNVALRTGCRVIALQVGANAQITSIVVACDGRSETIDARIIVVASGAVQTPALLLASANDNWPAGLANSSGQVGRNFMNHNCSAVIALHPLRRNRAIIKNADAE